MEPNANTIKLDAAARRPYKRKIRNILVHKPMQREFSFVLISLFMVASAAIAWVIHQTIRDAAFGGGFYFGKVNPFEILSDVSYTIIIRVTLVLILTLIIIGIYGITFLHRVAGPVYRFRQTFLKVNRGEIPGEVKIREGDFFQEVATEINVVLKRLRGDQEKIDGIKNRLNNFMQTAPTEVERKRAAELKEILDTFPPA